MFVVIKGLEDVGQNDLLFLLYWYCEVVLVLIFYWLFLGLCLWKFNLTILNFNVSWMIKIKVVVWDRYVIKGDFQVHWSNDETVEIFHRKARVVETGYDHIDLNLRKVTQLDLIQVVHHKHIIFFIVLFEEFFALFDRFLAKSCPRVRNQQSKYFMFLELSDQGESLHEGFRVINSGFFYLWHLNARYKNLRCPREERLIRRKTTHCEMNVRK